MLSTVECDITDDGNIGNGRYSLVYSSSNSY